MFELGLAVEFQGIWCGLRAFLFGCLVINLGQIVHSSTHFCDAQGNPCNTTTFLTTNLFQQSCTSCCNGWEGNVCSTDKNECNEVDAPCPAYCINLPGSFRCACPDTTQISADGRQCVNLCVLAQCEQRCKIVNVTAECHCFNGYSLDQNGINCTDIDECATNVSICADHPHSHCENTIGNYTCKCDTGYTENGTVSDWTCHDIDECTNGVALCTNTCTNTPGGYTCSCPQGYYLHNNHTCHDVDECAGNSTCPLTAICTNTPGSFNCSCPSGFVYNSVNNTCDNKDECVTPGVCVNGDCQDTQGSFQCNCHSGFEFFNKTFCKDINECNIKPTLCPMGCVNTIGGYECTCSFGWLANMTTHTCEKQPWNTCQQICQYDPNDHNKCICKCSRGFETDPLNSTQCIDIDECVTQPNICPNGRKCVNTVGGYHCDCLPGYINDWTNSGACIDKNECEEPHILDQCLKRKNRTCINTIGSYNCSCKEGFEEVSGVCTQIDECETGRDECEYYCQDSDGSYKCSCPPDQKLDSNLHNCSMIECEAPKLNNCDSLSANCTQVNLNCTDDDFYLNSSCQLTCDEAEGYYLDGPGLITCTNAGEWDDETSRCFCSDEENVTLSRIRVNETTGTRDNIDIIIEVPKCKPFHNHTIKYIDGLPPAIRILQMSDDSKKLLINKDLNQMVIPDLSTSNPEDTFSFELEVTHSYVNRTVIQSKQIDLTFVNVPQAPSIPDVKTPFTLSSMDNETDISQRIYDYNGDKVSCTLNDSLIEVDLIPTRGYKNSHSMWLRVKNGYTFKKVKERNNGSSSYNFTKELSCEDDSPEKMRSSKMISIFFTINDPLVDISEIQVQPNKTKLDQIPSVFEVKAWGKYMDNSNGKSKRKKYGVEGDDTSDDAEVEDMVESTTFEIKIDKNYKYSEYFEVKERTLKYIQKLEEPRTYKLPLLLTDTQDQSGEAKQFSVNIEIEEVKTQPDVGQIVTIVVVAVVVIVFGMLLLIYNFCRRPAFDKKESFRLNPVYGQELQDYYVDMENLEIDFDRKLGSGHFGVVYFGRATSPKICQRNLGEEKWVDVAVKELKDTGTMTQMDAFLKEVQALTMFKHRNIVSLLGIGICDGQHKYILMEHMNEGSLKDFLKSLRKKENNKIDLEEQHFIYMAAQVADAMCHMEKINAVHRDLAARNCLVNSKLMVKVADLGSATNLSTASGSLTEYYKVGGKPIPMRWSSPEVLSTGKHGIPSDVWSFGILFWEILTHCERPYSHIQNDTEVLDAIKGGEVLSVPNSCDPKISELIYSCWRYESEFRPKFSDIFEKLTAILTKVYEVAYCEQKDQLEVDIGIL